MTPRSLDTKHVKATKQSTLAFCPPAKNSQNASKGSYLPNTCWGKPALDRFEKDQANIFSWNINGFKATLDKGKLKEFMENAKPDVLCLNETKTDADKVGKSWAAEMPEEYEQHWNCCKKKKGYSGVAIFTGVKPLSVIHDLDIEKHD